MGSVGPRGLPTFVREGLWGVKGEKGYESHVGCTSYFGQGFLIVVLRKY